MITKYKFSTFQPKKATPAVQQKTVNGIPKAAAKKAASSSDDSDSEDEAPKKAGKNATPVKIFPDYEK